ncbi:SnoaL/DnrD family polyketide biosynthesis methyl ester cyclase [Streptomyces chartreusis]|uniref:SnoaL/DnrD family polyketide biosynthesis methyl ester cyclase n=1 Tax=Streptomyces chartreusis TaxID=1969 RepID=UPI0036B7446A
MSSNVDVVRRMVRAYNTGDTSDVEQYIHPEYLNPASLEHMADKNWRGPAVFAMAVKWLRATFSEEVRLEEIRYEERDDWVRAYLALYGRHVGELVGMPATGRRFSGEQIHLIKLVDGRIRDHRDWPDYLGTYRQLDEPWPTAAGWRH